MISVNEAKRLAKRAMLANLTQDDSNLSITPLLVGRHGIGKSQIIWSLAEELGGVCLTIEGGTLKEGEITGLPYQYDTGDGRTEFRFLPYYAVEWIQNEERRIFESLSGARERADCVAVGDNPYALNNFSPEEKISLLLERKVAPTIVFIDEINRTENTVYKELMNILLTRTVNGYRFPWWVFFVGAMNPSTQSSMYATNEMDPAQLDRFLKLKVTSSAAEWRRYGKARGISPDILSFIKENPKCLFDQSKELDDDEPPTPSPRGWEMVSDLLASEPLLRPFFSEKENAPEVVERDMKKLVSAKLGPSVATMFFASRVSRSKPFTPQEIFSDDEALSSIGPKIENLSVAKRVQTVDLLLEELKGNIEFMALNAGDFELKKRQIAELMKRLDPATQLLFAQKIAGATTNEGNSLIDFLFDILDDDVTAMLDLSEETKRQIVGS